MSGIPGFRQRFPSPSRPPIKLVHKHGGPSSNWKGQVLTSPHQGPGESRTLLASEEVGGFGGAIENREKWREGSQLEPTQCSPKARHILHRPAPDPAPFLHTAPGGECATGPAFPAPRLPVPRTMAEPPPRATLAPAPQAHERPPVTQSKALLIHTACAMTRPMHNTSQADPSANLGFPVFQFCGLERALDLFKP